jgi:hypothetical protein
MSRPHKYGEPTKRTNLHIPVTLDEWVEALCPALGTPQAPASKTEVMVAAILVARDHFDEVESYYRKIQIFGDHLAERELWRDK